MELIFFLNPEFRKYCGELSSIRNKEKVQNGTHHFVGDSNPSHNRILNGTHHLLGGNFHRDKANRPIYKEIKALMKELNIPVPRGTHMKSDKNLLELKNTLINNMNSGE